MLQSDAHLSKNTVSNMNDFITKTQWAPAMKIVAWDAAADTVSCRETGQSEAESYSVRDLEAYYPHIRQGLRAARCITGGSADKLGGQLEKWDAFLRQPAERPPLLGATNVLTGYQLGWLARWVGMDISPDSVKVALRKVIPGDAPVNDPLAHNKITIGCSKVLFEANFPGALEINDDCELLGMSMMDVVPILRTMILDRLRDMETLLPYDVSPA